MDCKAIANHAARNLKNIGEKHITKQAANNASVGAKKIAKHIANMSNIGGKKTKTNAMLEQQKDARLNYNEHLTG